MRKMMFNVWQKTLTLSGRISTKLTDNFHQSFVRFSNSVSFFLRCDRNFVCKFSGIFKKIFNVLKEDFNVEPENFDGFCRRFRAIILLCFQKQLVLVKSWNFYMVKFPSRFNKQLDFYFMVSNGRRKTSRLILPTISMNLFSVS